MNSYSYAAVVVLLVACQGSGKSTPDPEMTRQLEACKKSNEQKDKYAKGLNERIAELQLESEKEVIVTIQGDALNIVGTEGAPGPNKRNKTPVGNAGDQELYRSFLKAVNRSRGGIKKCYQRALKADSALQARTISLKIQVRYNTAGEVTRTSFAPRISSKFDSCMNNITKRWKLPAPPEAVTFRAPVTLAPQ